MNKVLLRTTIELRTLDNVIASNEQLRNDMYDEKRSHKRDKVLVAEINERIKKQDKVLQELRTRRSDLLDAEQKDGIEIAKALSLVLISCDVVDEFVWNLNELVKKKCSDNSGYEFLDRLMSAKRVISEISNTFIAENRCIHGSYSTLSESICKAIAMAVEEEFQRVIDE